MNLLELTLPVIMDLAEYNLEAFKTRFGYEPQVVARAPGRVNIIGEHTDYNGGLVLPFCIEQSIYVQMARNSGDNHRLFSKNLNDFVELDIHQNEKTNTHWVNCFIGALQQLDVFPAPASGLDVFISGDLPYGKGLSSSSALCCGFVAALAVIQHQKLSKLEVAKKAYRIEHDFIGIPCGFMDQFTITHGEAGKAILLDCATEEYEMVGLPKVQFMLVDSGIDRALHNSAYEERRNTCMRILKKANDYGLPITHISQIEKEDVEDLRYALTVNELKRLKYVLAENDRVIKAIKATPAALGLLLKLGMQGLREKFGVSCKEIDMLTRLLNQHEQVYGARMVGGGFGGCVLVLLPKGVKALALNDVLEDYANQTGCQPYSFEVKPSKGLEIA